MQDQTKKRQTRKRRKIKQKLCEDMISALPEDLLVQILLLLPTEDAVATAILSRRWRSVWKMLPRLEYYKVTGDESVWWSIDKSLLQLSKAPVLEKLSINLGPSCPVKVDVGEWVENVVNRCIKWLEFSLPSSLRPRSLSKKLYTCKTLKKLTLSDKILVDVPSQASLPSLVHLELLCVIYKDEDSLIRLLSSCLVLQNLYVKRKRIDNVIKFSVRVPSLQLLKYTNLYNDKRGDIGGSLVIDSPGLKKFNINDFWGDSCLIENMPPCLDIAKVFIHSHPSDKFLTSLSYVMYLDLTLVYVVDAICTAISFSRLIECKLSPFCSEYWVQSTMHLLENSPKLRVLMINSNDMNDQSEEDLPLGSSVPKCLSSRLEILEWEEYGGTREEKKLMTYILGNSNSLKSVRISLKSTYKNKEKKKKKKELESMHRVSESSQLFFTTQFRWSSMKQHPAYHVMSF